MKKAIFLSVFVLTFTLSVKANRGLLVYNFSQYEISFTIQTKFLTANYPILYTPDQKLTIAPFSNDFTLVNSAVNGISFAAPCFPLINGWMRQTTSSATPIFTPNNVAQSVFGMNQMWHFMKFGMSTIPENEMIFGGTVSYFGNSAGMPFSLEYLNTPQNTNINVEWFEIPNDSNQTDTIILFTEY